MRQNLLFLALVIFSALMFACGGCGSSGSGDGGDPGGVATIAVYADGAAVNGTIGAPKGRTVSLTLDARTASGSAAAVDAALVRWETDDPGFVIGNSDGRTTLTASKDWFDSSGSEPATTVTVRYGDRSATAKVTGVIDATGDWTAKLDEGITQKLSLSQQGRTITDAKTHVSGTIEGNSLAIYASGFAINATFSSRTHAAGTYSGSGLRGTFDCVKEQ